MPQWNFWFFISFVVFGAAVYGPSSSMVDYTAERRKTEREREKSFCMFSPLHHGRPYNTERRSFVWERKIFKFHCVCVCVFVCVCVCVCVCLCVCNVFQQVWGGGGVGEEMTRGCVLTTFLWGRLHREKKDWEREREKSFCMFYITCGPTTQREEIFF